MISFKFGSKKGAQKQLMQAKAHVLTDEILTGPLDVLQIDIEHEKFHLHLH